LIRQFFPNTESFKNSLPINTFPPLNTPDIHVAKNALPDHSIAEIAGDESLLRAFNSNDSRSFAVVYRRFYPNVFFFARRFVGSEDAQDITAEAFYKLWKREKNFRRLSSVKIYLQVIARNDCYTLLETKKNKSVREKEFIYFKEFTSATGESLEDIQAGMLNRIQAEIEKMPAQMKKVFKMVYIERQKNNETARKLKLSENTVRGHKTKGLALLRIAAKSGSWMLLLLFPFVHC
jgi:RNA polymerase sigma-70 factor (ECF subfamily)